MRITKDPEERRQEILDTAMRLFYENGYEKTSISDIARSIGVAQGLCYRYFPSKEALFESALEQYVQQLADAFLPIADPSMPIREVIGSLPGNVETSADKYYSVFHKAENRKFHDQLSLRLCEKMVPMVTSLLQAAHNRGELAIDDIPAAASFAVYGQLGVLLNRDIPEPEKQERIRAFLLFALHLS